MRIEHEMMEALQGLIDDGWITEILHEVKSGKEATVYCVRGGPRSPEPLLAAKVYRPLLSRAFKNDAIYQTGRVHLAHEGRVSRATTSGSKFGREVQAVLWLEHEWETMRHLHDGGMPIPRPIARNERCLLLPFIGTEDEAAPGLHLVDLPRVAVEETVDDLLGQIEWMLDLQRVHADLSPYNILYRDERPVIIDFPQTIDPRLNRAGQELLTRDVTNVCQWAERRGVRRNANRIAIDLWIRFVNGELGA